MADERDAATGGFGAPRLLSEVPLLVAATGLLASGDRGTRRAFQDAGEAVGRALAIAAMLLNPETIVVGGELASAGEALFEPMRRALVQNTMTSHADPLDIVPSSLGDSAGVRGAAALVLERLPEALALGSDYVSSS